MERLDAPAPAPQSFSCPECGTEVPLGAPACGRCGIRLVGPLAQQLWRVDQQIARLSGERRHLRDLLLQPPTPEELAQGVRPSAALPAFPAPQVVNERRSLSGQQILLGLGALLLLSGVAFFLVVVWSLIGLVGQSLVMVVLTVTAAGSAVLATRKRLSAAAETAAVIASGLVVLDLNAAHALGLVGLDRVDGAAYWAGAGIVGALVLLAFDRWVPRRDEAGELRRILTYRPVALALVTFSLWSAVWALTPGDVGDLSTSALALLLVVLSVGLAVAGSRLDGASSPLSPSAVVPWLSAAYALLMHLGIALDVGYGTTSNVDRLVATLLLFVAPVGVLLAQRLPVLAGRPALRTGLRLLGLAGVAIALGVPVFAASRPVVALVALAVGAGLVVLALRGQDGPVTAAWDELGWGDLLTWVGRASVAGLFFLLYLLISGGHASGTDMEAWRSGAGPGAWWLPLLPAVALVVPSTVTVLRRGSVPVAALAHVSAVAGLLLALRDEELIVWAAVCLAGAVVCVAVAAGSRWARIGSPAVGLEVVALVAGSCYAAATLGAALNESAFVLSAVLVGLGAVLAAYAALPGRLWAAYVAVVALGSALWVQLADAEVGTVEWYTLPVALMLAGIGAVQWRRDPAAPTWLTMAPALLLGFVPSLVVALADDSTVRLLVVTAAAIAVLLVGVARAWQAPVVVAALVLGLVAWTQGGPLVAYVDGWILLTLSGLALLVAGVQWERSIALGRRTWTWLGAMQ